jgi:hypothetical protein
MKSFVKIKQGKTPADAGLSLSKKHPMKLAPDNGWEERTWYLVEVAFSNNNPVHRSLFFTGFLTDGKPCGYNEFARTEDKLEYHESVYLYPVERLFSEKEKGII